MSFFASHSGLLPVHRTATPVLIGSRGALPEGRLSMRVPERLAFGAARVSAVVPVRQTLGLAPFRFALALIQPLGFAAFVVGFASEVARLRQAFWAVPYRFALQYLHTFWAVLVSRPVLRGHTEKPVLSSSQWSNPALNLVRFAHWTLRGKAAQRRLALR